MEDQKRKRQKTSVVERATPSVLQPVLDQLKTARHLLEKIIQSKVHTMVKEELVLLSWGPLSLSLSLSFFSFFGLYIYSFNQVAGEDHLLSQIRNELKAFQRLASSFPPIKYVSVVTFLHCFLLLLLFLDTVFCYVF